MTTYLFFAFYEHSWRYFVVFSVPMLILMT